MKKVKLPGKCNIKLFYKISLKFQNTKNLFNFQLTKIPFTKKAMLVEISSITGWVKNFSTLWVKISLGSLLFEFCPGRPSEIFS
jgi:hypothetical protein